MEKNNNDNNKEREQQGSGQLNESHGGGTPDTGPDKKRE